MNRLAHKTIEINCNYVAEIEYVYLAFIYFLNIDELVIIKIQKCTYDLILIRYVISA